jgi:hypothetical protein
LGEHPDEYFEMFLRMPAEERRRDPHTHVLDARPQAVALTIRA